jgi:regulator of protease activity HflC (stomatin/prohibitin superfamily)
VLPLKEKEIEQRRLEAEARKIQRTKDAEGDAAARGIEAVAEADARRKLSDADAYRIEVMGKASSEQLARDSALIARNPLLIQKTLADKLSDKIQVIVAPPAAGGFFAGGLLGMNASANSGLASGSSGAGDKAGVANVANVANVAKSEAEAP